ncbi:hypothetical protein FACS1894200_11980 [Spirochaetia bacterium]|nr:hypothetical protein FACS1894200_11980 [Spirochaetia bacterium]
MKKNRKENKMFLLAKRWVIAMLQWDWFWRDATTVQLALAPMATVLELQPP